MGRSFTERVNAGKKTQRQHRLSNDGTRRSSVEKGGNVPSRPLLDLTNDNGSEVSIDETLSQFSSRSLSESLQADPQHAIHSSPFSLSCRKRPDIFILRLLCCFEAQTKHNLISFQTQLCSPRNGNVILLDCNSMF